MSFFSSLLCCSGTSADEDSHVRPRPTNGSKRVGPVQSNIQKSLAASISERPVSAQPKPTSAQISGKPPKSDLAQLKSVSKPFTNENTTGKDSSDSSKDTQSITVLNDELTINETTTEQHLTRSTLTDESTGHIADTEQDAGGYESPETEQNSISSSSSDDFERGEELDLITLQPGQSCASTGFLLEKAPLSLSDRKCLVLDLDETLVHSSFKYVRQADFVIPVEIEGQVHNVYVIKRPGVDEFLQSVAQWYEVVVFTASVSRYGDPLLDILDKDNNVHSRLFRDSCYNYQGNYIKNLSQMGRDLKNLIIIDNSPASYIFHPQHAVPISSWFSDTHDCELLDILPLLKDLSGIDDIRMSLDINI